MAYDSKVIKAFAREEVFVALTYVHQLGRMPVPSSSLLNIPVIILDVGNDDTKQYAY
jgi:hypothetical protein